MTEEEVDVAIVGGGVAGCYAGYRLCRGRLAREMAFESVLSPLLDRGGALRVAIYERSDRIGGRLWSASLPGLPDVAADFGGMRFHDEAYVVSDLVRHLGLDAGIEGFSFGEPENLIYARGLRLRRRDLPAATLPRSPGGPLYRLAPGERGKGADELHALVAEAAVPGFSALRARHHEAHAARRWRDADRAAQDYEGQKRASRVAGVPLLATSWWTLLSVALSSEAIHLLQDTDGYDTLASCGSAAAWLDNLFYTPPGVRHLRLAGGFEALPRALLERYRAAGGQTRLGHRLRRFDRAGGGPGYELSFECGDGAAPRSVRARVLVLAMPQRGLLGLDQGGFFFRDDAVRRALPSVKSVAAVKLFLAYPSPWWEQVGVVRGRSTTDLPLRQSWYWGAARGPGGPALILAAYANGPAAAYWTGLAGGEPFPDPPDAPALDRASPPLAPRKMVDRAHALLAEMHGVEAPPPCAARWQDWSAAPHEGGWYVWQEGYDPAAIIPLMRRPLSGEEVFVASDAWSHDPGSVQGSLSNVEHVLQDHLGLSWPPWLRREGTRLGP